MNRRVLISVGFLSLVMGSWSLPAAARIDVIWLSEIEVERSVNINNETFALLTDDLDVSLQYQQTNTRRALHRMLNKRVLTCRGNLMKTPDRASAYAWTSLPQLVFPGQMLYSNVNLNVTGEVSIASLLASGKGVLGIHQGRAYGIGEDALLRQYPEHIYAIESGDNTRIPILLFTRKRIDFLMEYPNVYDFYVEQPAPVHVYPIQGQAQSVQGFIACTDNQSGQKLVKMLDAAIQRVSAGQAYYDVHIKWFRSAAHTVTQAYNEAFSTAFAHSQ